MIKKLSILTLLISLVIPISAFAASFDYGYWGTTTETDYIIANNSDRSDYWTDVTVEGSGSGYVRWLGAPVVEGQQNVLGTSSVPGKATAPSGAVWMQLVSEDGGEIYATIAHSTNPVAETVNFTSGSSGGGSSGGSSGGGGSTSCTITNSCDVFQCPAWDEYMGKVNAILNKIPEEPNWQRVSETFRDTIAPRIKSDMADLLGKAPSLPDEPKKPGGIVFEYKNKPQGQEDPGLGDSTFSKDDVKNGAKTIQEREDPTDGFNIENPVDNLKDPPNNKPKEQENNAAVPDEQENKAPTPTEQENSAPSPNEQEAEAPTPTEQEATAPTPKDEGAAAPTPNEQENSAPLPSQDDNSAPIPDSAGGDYPMPSKNNDSAPLPGDSSNWMAPLPSN